VSPNDDFKRELNNVFDAVSGAPSSNLRDRVRSAVSDAPAQRSTYWIAAVAAMLVTALIVGILYVNNPFRRPTGLVNPGVTPSPATSPSTLPSPSASPSPLPSPTANQYICTADTLPQMSPKGDPIAYVSAARTGAHPAYDRFVLQFAGGFPTDFVELTPRSGTSFSETPSGQTIKLKGSNGILVRIHGADMHTSYTGKTDWVTGYQRLAEVRVLEDFEGSIIIGLGVSGNGPACYHAFYLTNPNVLIIDVLKTP
jgi:hypothetical protein